MYKSRIAALLTGLLLVLSVFCSASFAQDQGRALIEAARKGDLKRVQELMEKGGDVNTKDKGNDGITALMTASIEGHLGIVRFLLKRGSNVNDQTDSCSTALTFSAEKGHLEIAKLLLENGANVNIGTGLKDCWTALEAAAHHGQVELVKLLLAHKAPTLRHAMMQASLQGHFRVVELLLENGADVNEPNEWDGTTPLMDASLGGHLEIVKLLVKRGANVAVKDGSGQTPLRKAEDRGHKEIVKLLKARGAKE